MARCGCTPGADCACAVQADPASDVSVTGNGSGATPYVVGFDYTPSADADNAIILGTDDKLWAPEGISLATGDARWTKRASQSGIADVNRRTGGAVAINSTSWMDVDNALDAVIAAATGDYVEVGVNLSADAAAFILYVDAQSIVSAVPTNSLLTGAAVDNAFTSAWRILASVAGGITASVLYVVQAGDLDGGNVRVRLRARVGSAGTKNIDASATAPVVFWARNHG